MINDKNNFSNKHKFQEKALYALSNHLFYDLRTELAMVLYTQETYDLIKALSYA